MENVFGSLFTLATVLLSVTFAIFLLGVTLLKTVFKLWHRDRAQMSAEKELQSREVWEADMHKVSKHIDNLNALDVRFSVLFPSALFLISIVCSIWGRYVVEGVNTTGLVASLFVLSIVTLIGGIACLVKTLYTIQEVSVSDSDKKSVSP